MGKVLVILASARRESDTRKFLDTALAGIDHKVIDLLDHRIEHYSYENKYSGKDEFDEVVNELLEHDNVIFATPVYWYAMSGRLKVFFDRLTDLVTYKKRTGRKLKGKQMFLLAAGADKELPPGFEKPFELTAGYLSMIYKGSIYYSTNYSVSKLRLHSRISTFTRLFTTS